MSDDMDPNGRPALTGEILMELHRQGNVAATEAASVRGDYGTALKSKQETHGLNTKAFKMASTIRKMENGKREHFFRDLLHYCDLMQVNQQKDILDTLADNTAGKPRSDLEAAMDGQPREVAADAKGQPVKTGHGSDVDPGESFGHGNVSRLHSAYSPNSALGKHHLKTYSEGVREMTDREAITRGLESFCSDHPKLADEARVIAKDRLAKLGDEQGGGEDLRPAHLREAEATGADQAADTGKRTGRSRKKAGEAGATAH